MHLESWVVVRGSWAGMCRRAQVRCDIGRFKTCDTSTSWTSQLSGYLLHLKKYSIFLSSLTKWKKNIFDARLEQSHAETLCNPEYLQISDSSNVKWKTLPNRRCPASHGKPNDLLMNVRRLQVWGNIDDFFVHRSRMMILLLPPPP